MKKRPLPKTIRKAYCWERLKEHVAHEKQVKALQEESSSLPPQESISLGSAQLSINGKPMPGIASATIDYSPLEVRIIDHINRTGDGHHRLAALRSLAGGSK